MNPRKRIAKDVLLFGVPFMAVFLAGLMACAADGWNGMLRAIWELIADPEARGEFTIWKYAGLLFFLGGLAIAITGACTLKKFYSSTLIIREDHQLITHGLYRFVRHPLYFGVLVAMMGFPLSVLSWKGFLFMSLEVPLFLFRIRTEEAMLEERFGEAYREYRKATKKLIPFLL